MNKSQTAVLRHSQNAIYSMYGINKTTNNNIQINKCNETSKSETAFTNG